MHGQGPPVTGAQQCLLPLGLVLTQPADAGRCESCLRANVLQLAAAGERLPALGERVEEEQVDDVAG
jgi:hypothetical protein